MIRITASTGKSHYKTDIKTETNAIVSDEPTSIGGQDLGFTPSQLLASSLASCTGITLRMYADRKGWNLEETMIDVTFDNKPETKEHKMTMNIRVFGTLDETQKNRLLEIAHNCPIHKLLEKAIPISVVLKD